MRSFHQLVVFLFALFACSYAQDTAVYDATVYITSTVYRVNTVYESGSPTGTPANMTSTISATRAANASSTRSPSSTAKPSQPEFSSTAVAINANAFAAIVVAGLGYLVL